MYDNELKVCDTTIFCSQLKPNYGSPVVEHELNSPKLNADQLAADPHEHIEGMQTLGRILLQGPPDTGNSTLIKALASETGWNLLPVSIHQMIWRSSKILRINIVKCHNKT